MRKPSIHPTNSDLIHACQHLAEMAEAFVSRVPQQKASELERLALFDAIFHAQLVLSVARLLPKGEKQQEEARGFKNQQSQAKSARWPHRPEQLDWLIDPVSTTDENHPPAIEVRIIIPTAARPPARVLPFRRLP